MISSVFVNLILNTTTNAKAKHYDQELIDSMVLQLPTVKEDTQKVKILNTIAFTYNSVNPKEGIKYVEQSLNLSDKLGWKNGKAAAFNTKGSIYETQSNHTDAIDNFNKALEIYEGQGEKEKIGVSKEYMGNVYLASGDFSKALKSYYEVLKINLDLKDNYNVARNYGNIAMVYQAIGDYDLALEFNKKSLVLHKIYADNNALAIGHNNIANAYNGKSNYDSALFYNQQALKSFEEKGDKNGYGISLCNLGEIYKNKGEYLKALELFFESHKISDSNGFKLNAANTLGNIGETYLCIAKSNSIKIQPNELVPDSRDKIIEKAIEYLERAVTECKAISDFEGAIEFTKKASEALQMAGKYAEALEKYKQYSQYKDSIYSSAKLKDIAVIEASQILALKNNQLASNQTYISGKKDEVSILFAALGFLFLTTAVIIVVYNNYRKVQNRISR